MNHKKITGLLVIFFLAALPFFLSACGNNGVIAPEIPLEVWGVFDESMVFDSINTAYSNKTSRVSEITYKKISNNPAEFEKELIDAFASGKGPDVLFFSNAWLKKHENKIAPMPGSDTYLAKHKNEFVDVVSQDFFKDNQVFALPLYCDTLALYYNRNALNQAGITAPPATWDDVKKQTKALTKIDEFGNITQSAIALGRSKAPGAINRSSDILVLMMLQNGAVLNNTEGLSFAKSLNKGFPGLSALDFYSQFSQANSDVYTWSNKMHYSEDAFQDGEVAMIIGYPYKYDQLKKNAPKLNFDVAPVPQLSLDSKINFANYWGLAVAKNKEIPAGSKYNNTDRINEAWKYVSYLTTKPANPKDDPTRIYLEKTNKVSARKDIINEQKDENPKGIFAEQALTAKSWIVPDETAADEIMTDMINTVADGESTAKDALDRATARFNAIWK